MSKVVAPRDTKLRSGRELTNSNLFLFQVSSEKETRRLYRLKLDNRRIGLDRKSRQAFSDHETFTKRHRLNFHSGKTVDQPIPSRKSEDLPRTASAGESILEKGRRNFILVTRDCCLERVRLRDRLGQPRPSSLVTYAQTR